MRDLHPADKIHHRYNDQVMAKWIFSLFIHTTKQPHYNLKLTLTQANALNWALLHECLKVELEAFHDEGNRVSILDLIADVEPEYITLDMILTWWALNAAVMTEAAVAYIGDYELRLAMQRFAKVRYSYELAASTPDWFN